MKDYYWIVPLLRRCLRASKNAVAPPSEYLGVIVTIANKCIVNFRPVSTCFIIHFMLSLKTTQLCLHYRIISTDVTL